MRQIDPRNFDFDIFIRSIFIGHFASAGGDIPMRVISDPFHDDFRHFLKSDKERIMFKYEVNPNIQEILTIKAANQNFNLEEFNRQAYLQDFIEFAIRGVFSFDRTYLSESKNMHFHLVAYPIFDERFEKFVNDLSSFSEQLNYLKHFYARYNVRQLNDIIESIINRHFNKPFNFERLFLGL